MEAVNFSHLSTHLIVVPAARNRHSPLPSLNCMFLSTHLGKAVLLSSVSLKNIDSLLSSRSLVTATSNIDGRNVDGGGLEEDTDGNMWMKNRAEAFLALDEAGRSLDSIPDDLAAAIESGGVPGAIVHRFFELEKSPAVSWLLTFRGFKERLLADDLFLTKIAFECGVGIFTKTAAELERRQGNFMKELDFVFADVAMAIIADFMLVWLPAPTVSLEPPVAMKTLSVNRFLFKCPDNAFQVALAGTSYTFLQRIGAIVKSGGKLFLVGTGACLAGTSLTAFLIAARKILGGSFADVAEDLPILSTSVAYGIYMAVSSNLRYQILAGLIEQRFLEPLLREHVFVLSLICFGVRTGNTFLGSLMNLRAIQYMQVGGLCTLDRHPKDSMNTSPRPH